MFDIGWSELMLVGIVALIVVGPKDLPRMFHALGQFTAKARAMARDFQYAMEQAAREAGAEDITKDLNSLRSMTSPKSLGLDALSSAGEAFERWDENKRRGIDGDPETKDEVEAPATDAAASDTAGTEAAPEHGPATAELAAKRKAKAAAADAKAAEIASAAEAPAAAEAKPARKPRKRTTKAAPAKAATAAAEEGSAAQPETAEAPAPKKPRARKTATAKAAATDGDATATAKPARKPRAKKTETASADAAKPRTPRKRATPGKTDA